MFVKPLTKYHKSSGERYLVYQLCESYRIDGYVRHRNIVGLGQLKELNTADDIKLLGKRIEEMIKYGPDIILSENSNKKIEGLALHFYNKIKIKRTCDLKENTKKEWETVDIQTLKNKDAKEVGAEWLCKQAFDQLGIARFLQQKKWSNEDIGLATTHIISRTVYPASELKTVSFIKENSAVCELTGYPSDTVTKDKLYRISHKLFSVKDELEQYLSTLTNELFDLNDKIILYDLTNTYFEGRMQNSKIAKFGRSKEKRKDARLIVLAVVINTEGFLKYSNIFEGNMTDSKTLETIIKALSRQTSRSNRKPIVVIDAGIATEDNLSMLKKDGYDYMCVSRSNIKQYRADTTKSPVQIVDTRKQPIELMKVNVEQEPNKENNGDVYLWVKSKAKALKENSMNGLLSQRFEEGIEAINQGINKKGGTKKLNKVHERLGRIKEKYPSVHKYYDVTITDDGNQTATSIRCEHKKGEDPDKRAGIYFLRTTLDDKNETTLWHIYNVIREIEYTFRVLKTDLDLRPIYHKTDNASMAHLNLGLLAYWLVSTIRYQLKQKGFNSQWNEIVRTMNTQKCVTTSMTNIDEKRISVRKCTEPTRKVKQIYDILKYKYVPFHRKKSVDLPEEILKIDST